MISTEIETTHYYIKENGIEETTTKQQGSFEVRTWEHRPDEKWLILNGGPYSMQITEKSVENTAQHGWLAQLGTKPVCIDGIWGGRNYPKIYVQPERMREVWAATMDSWA